MKHVGIVSVYGRANAGKSTLINKILGYKLLPVSDKPQTTRDNVKAIYNDSDSQIVFVDTPGVFKPHGKLGSILLKESSNSLEGIDLVLYVIDISESINLELANKLKNIETPILIIFNKIDLIDINLGEKRIQKYLEVLKDSNYIRTSLKEDFGINEVIDKIKTYLPEGDKIFEDDIATDRTNEYVVSEFIREKCMRLLEKEVPHSVYIEMKNLTIDDERVEVIANIIVEKDSEKGIVIGKNGNMIKKISSYSEQSIQNFFQLPTSVQLNVKTIKDWRNQDKYLKKFGYEK